MGGFLGMGDTYIDRDVLGKFYLLGNVTKFAINETETDIKERVSKMTSTYGQALDRVAMAKPAKISIESDGITGRNIAIALRASIEDLSDSGNVTDEAFTAKLDYFVPLAHMGVSTVVVTNVGATTTYVVDTDYVVEAQTGMIKALSTGDITADQSLLIDYAYANTGKKIKGSQATEIECAIRFKGINKTNSKKCTIIIYKARLISNTEIDFLSDDFQKLGLEGTLITPEDKTMPYEIAYEE